MATDDDDDPVKLRPTIIGSVDNKPTRLASGSRTSCPANAGQPTLMSMPPRRAAAAADRDQVILPIGGAPGAVTAPTAIPGVERKRIDVRPEDIAGSVPGASSAALAAAARLVRNFAIDGARDRDIVLWGHDLQQSYGSLVSQTLELGQAEILTKVAAYLDRMTSILASIDLEGIGRIAPTQSILGQFLGRSNARIDSGEEFEAARREVDQLVELMAGSLERLLVLKESLERQSRRIDDLGDAVEAAAYAAAFLSKQLRAQKPSFADRFDERSMGLTQTLAQLRESKALREVHIERPLGLIAAIQNVALVAVPGLILSVAALAATTSATHVATPTEVGELKYRLAGILQHLKI